MRCHDAMRLHDAMPVAMRLHDACSDYTIFWCIKQIDTDEWTAAIKEAL